MSKNLDEIDLKILAEIQADGRITNVELAKRVGISPPPCLRRVRTLEEAGYIQGYRGLLDPRKLGFDVTVFASVHLSSQADAAAANQEKPAYTEIDLTDTLRGLGVAEDTIKLLDEEMGTNGMFVLVHAGDRGDEAESILDRNRGFVRTVMITERTHAAH